MVSRASSSDWRAVVALACARSGSAGSVAAPAAALAVTRTKSRRLMSSDGGDMRFSSSMVAVSQAGSRKLEGNVGRLGTGVEVSTREDSGG